MKILLLILGLMLLMGTVSATTWTLSSTNWVGNTTFDNTTIKYQNVELLNGWDPSNVVHIKSGGSKNYLKSPDKKQAFKYEAQFSINVTNVSILPCCYYPDTTQPNWTVGIQVDSSGEPSGSYLGSGILYGPNIPDEVWQDISISPEVSLTEGNTYWIVIQYHSGSTPTSTTHWLGLRAEAPAVDFMGDNIPMPYNYVGPNKNINDNGTTTVRLYDGAAWITDSGGRNLGVFMLTFNDSTYHGQPYRHNYIDVRDERMVGERFTIDVQNKTVDKLDMPWNARDYSGAGRKPLDDLYYYIKENDENGAIIANGTFLTKEEVINTGGAYPSIDRKWYNISLSPTITLINGTNYFLYFTSPGSNSSVYWGSDGPNAFGVFSSSTYDQSTSYVRRWQQNWGCWNSDSTRDLSFRFHLVDVYKGNLTSITKDAESVGSVGDVWTQIRYEGSIPSGTNVSITVNSSTCGGFVSVQNEAVSGTTYELPACAQEQHANWRFTIQTDNTSVTSEIENVVFSTGKSWSPSNQGVYWNVTNPIEITRNGTINIFSRTPIQLDNNATTSFSMVVTI